MTLVLRAIAVLLPSSVSIFAQDWPYIGRDAGGTRHSSLAQINRGNVAVLAVMACFASHWRHNFLFFNFPTP